MNKKGFTLIEIIIVIVILGILATLAVPKITGQMKTAEAGEAMNFFGAIRRAASDCLTMSGGDSSACLTATQLGVSVPTNAKFTYYHNNAAATDTAIGWGARNNDSAGNPTGDWLCVTLTVDQAAGNTKGDVTAVAFSAASAASGLNQGAFAGIASKSNGGSAGTVNCSSYANAYNI